jgi:hypothetical protein
MSKENTIFRTMEIKSSMLESLKLPFDRLAFCIKDNNLKAFVETLHKCKIQLEIKDENGNTLLNLAVQANTYEISNYLIILGAKVNTQDVFIH